MATTDLYLCLDQGGHASRAIVFDGHGRMHAQAFCNIDTRRKGDRVEHDPKQLVESLRSAAHDVVTQLGSSATRLVAAGLATQRSSIVCWQRDSGVALSPVISWQDTRAAEWLDTFIHEQDRVHAITGLVMSPHFGVSKLRWCLDHLPAVRQAHARSNLVFGPLASFLVSRLTDQSHPLADPANASRTLLYDRHTGNWSKELLTLFDVPRECLPESVPSRHDWGELWLENFSLPISVVTGDQSAALFAFGEPDAVTVYANLGTGAFLQQTTGSAEPDPGRLLASVVYQDEHMSSNVIEATVNGAGSAMNRIASDLNIHTDRLKADSGKWLQSFSGELLFINAVSGLGSPWWLPNVPSQFAGADGAAASDADRMAAVLESIAFLIAVNLEAMDTILGRPVRMLVTGGLGSVDPLMQRIANLVRLPIERAESIEATAKGLACLLAGLPDSWPGAQINKSFVPQADADLMVRYQRWRELMPELATAT